jgi:hypothetical protein
MNDAAAIKTNPFTFDEFADAFDGMNVDQAARMVMKIIGWENLGKEAENILANAMVGWLRRIEKEACARFSQTDCAAHA